MHSKIPSEKEFWHALWLVYESQFSWSSNFAVFLRTKKKKRNVFGIHLYNTSFAPEASYLKYELCWITTAES